jgi:hypothetical protein
MVSIHRAGGLQPSSPLLFVSFILCKSCGIYVSLFSSKAPSRTSNLIATYLAEIWDFLIFIGQICAFIVVFSGAILWFLDTNSEKGKGLVMSGILLSVVVEYFVLFPPSFVTI